LTYFLHKCLFLHVMSRSFNLPEFADLSGCFASEQP
jgi:hypothetical protein